MRKIALVVIALLLGTMAAHADSLVTARPAGTDSIDWGQFAPELSHINSGSTFTTADGATGTISYGPEPYGVLYSPSIWGGNLDPSNWRNYAFAGSGAMTLTFAQGFDQIGAQIQAQGFAPFTATICDSNGCFSEDGVSDGNRGTAIYLGISGSDISWVSFSATEYGSADNFAINQVTLDPTAIPEPSSLLLFGTGLIGIAGAMRRRFAR
jgi:hypothetical protein